MPKRKFDTAETRVVRNGLVVRVQVSEIGPTWFFEIKVPFWAIDLEELQREAQREADREAKSAAGPSHDIPLPFDR